MSFYNKLKWVLGILLIFVLIIATNLIDKKNFVLVRDSVVTIYEDRLIANDLIFEMVKSVHQKELAVSQSDTSFFTNQNGKVNDHLESLVSRFEETKLTSEEAIVFEDLKNNLQSLKDSEAVLMEGDFKNSSKVNKHIESLQTNLTDLSKIQLNEGSKQMSISQRAVNSLELFSQIEISMLVFLGILIQIIVMYNPKKEP